MIWDSFEDTGSYQAERNADKANAKADRLGEDLSRIRRHLDRLSLSCQAMWELLRDHSDLTEEDIEAKVLEIDARDGAVDGRMSPKVMDCSSCGRPTNSSRSTCLMCGAPVDRPHQFEG